MDILDAPLGEGEASSLRRGGADRQGGAILRNRNRRRSRRRRAVARQAAEAPLRSMVHGKKAFGHAWPRGAQTRASYGANEDEDEDEGAGVEIREITITIKIRRGGQRI
jgi:hypothetical protein